MELLKLKENIDKLGKTNQIEILRILKNNNECFTENNNGTFVNLIHLNDKTITEMNQYLEYISLQSYHLKEVEKKKSELLSEYFTNPNSSNESTQQLSIT
tara:strand:- start:403 stop:702 length:300 start_codon:yes stop_codon:yes gene_type:complete